jgi:hypothetical protein
MSTFQLDGGPPPSQKLGVRSDGWMTFITTGADEVRRRRWPSDDDAAIRPEADAIEGVAEGAEARSLPSNSGLPFGIQPTQSATSDGHANRAIHIRTQKKPKASRALATRR